MRRGVSALAIASTFLMWPSPAHCLALLSAARIRRQGDALEVHFTISSRVRWRLSHLGSQLRIELQGTRVELPPRPLFGYETLPLSSVRVMNTGHGAARVLIEVGQKTDYAVGSLPGELLVRLAPAGKVRDLASLKVPLPPRAEKIAVRSPPPAKFTTRPPDEMSEEAESDSDEQPEQPIRTAIAKVEPPAEKAQGHIRVMIDPGHGGHDPGTEAGEIAEKTLALEISKRVAGALERRGIDAVLTRDDDVFLSLAERTELGNREGADLFLSIHLNSSPDPETNGIEVYYLNNTTDRATIRLARMENAWARDYGARTQPNLNYILSDLRQQYKATESALLAQLIEEQTVTELRDSFAPDVRGLGAKKGPFYVLVGAHMPAVLVECGFLSNEQEARRLASPTYQQRLADAVGTAVVHYLNADVTAGTL